jgi:hypothetical protein
MSALGAALDGLRRVGRAPALLAGVWALTLAISLPLAIVMRGMLAEHLGRSLAADAALTGTNYEWMQEFASQAAGVGVTFRPTVIGFGAVVDNLSAFVDAASRPAVVAAAAAAYILVWLFLAGGIIDRLARDRPARAHGFFAACGVFFFRFLRLAAAQAIVYGLLFGPMHRWLFDRLYPRMIHEVDVERTAFFARAVLYLVFGILVSACAMVFDYAKVRAVVEDRRSMIGAITAGVGFIRRNYAAAVTLFAIDFLLFAAVVALYALVAPGAGRSTMTIAISVAIGQLYVLARLCVKLVFWGSEAALFQSRLAHAGYTARPEPVWPDSPAAEMI